MPGSAYRTTVSAFALAGLVVASGGCIESRGVASPEIKVSLSVRLRPELDSALANTPASTRIARLQAELRLGTSREVLATHASTLNPDEPDVEPVAQVEFEVARGQEFDIEGDLRLIGEDELVQWSGIFGPAPMDSETETWEFSLDMGRGDFSNLSITGISVSGLEDGLLEGETASLDAIVNGGSHDLVVFWGSKDPSVLMVDGEGNVTGVSAGEGTIVAAAGKHSTAVTVRVLPEPAGS